MLDVPSLGHHPVHPVGDTTREPLGEGAPVEAAGHDAALGLRGVVAAVAHVVADHGPARADGGGHHERRDRVDVADEVEGVGEEGRGEHDREAAEVEGVRPREDLVEVVDVILIDVRLELLLDRADLGGPRLEVERLAPLARLVVRHLHRGLGAGHRDRGADLERAAARRHRGHGLDGRDRSGAAAKRLRGASARERQGRGDGHGGHEYDCEGEGGSDDESPALVRCGSGAAPQEFHPSVRARAGDRTPPRRSVTQETAPTRDAQIFWNCHL